MTKRLLGGALGIAALAAIVWLSIRAGSGGKAARVYAETAARRDITQTVKASGQIHPRVEVDISAHVVGKIEKLFVREGDSIAAGEPFLQLEQQSFLAARDDARARLAMAETELEQSRVAVKDRRVKLERARRLHGEGIASQEALEAAELQLASDELRLRGAREAVAQSRALLDKAEDDLRKTTIWAPLSGRVIALRAEEGEVVVSGTMNNPASVIGTVADLSEILAEVDVDETEVVHVRPDLAATVEVDAVPEVEFAARVVEVGSSGYAKPSQPDVQFFRVRLLLERPDERLRPGMSARAEIRVTTRPAALVVPIQAVVDRPPTKPRGGGAASPADSADEIPVAFVVERDVARQKPVRIGISDATHVEVVSGLADSDLVVTGPYRALKKLHDGDRVHVTASKAGAEDEEPEEEEEDASGDEGD